MACAFVPLKPNELMLAYRGAPAQHIKPKQIYVQSTTNTFTCVPIHVRSRDNGRNVINVNIRIE
jgi:hypothetical protein